MENVLFLTLVMIFVAAVVGIVIRYHGRDKCLLDFEGFLTTVDMAGGKEVWGRMKVYSNAIEWIYPQPHLDPDGRHFETSFILYQDQFPDMMAIQRFHDELTPRNQVRRSEEIRRTYHPGAGRRLKRRLRNLFNLLRDAVTQAFSTILVQARKATGSTLLATQDGRISDTARQIIGAAASAYEPILERYIGRKVVLEVAGGDGVREYCGILKEYTDRFITVLDVLLEESYAFSLRDPDRLRVNRNLDFVVASSPAGKEDSRLRADVSVQVTNRGNEAVRLSHAEAEGYHQPLDRELPPGGKVEVKMAGVPVPGLPEPPAGDPRASGSGGNEGGHGILPDLRLWIRARRSMDMAVPRSRCVVRHGAEEVGAPRLRSLVRLLRPEDQR